ncbi:hypothetical protein CKO50_20330 [Pseudoalteromonas sp. HM-SA03]|uniref:recombinase family protein n=1 Tax=Pseudoalteromonas sp. HM-SA03 TaxID=2029678 RepID=UPI000BAE5559|nr:recombinase family protein [Pseudoalteromonas sp. HM-SA03]PAX99561.1 hypothetical protein CKO50_20330 [Pseudoalteromonas sp. HM-SA03]
MKKLYIYSRVSSDAQLSGKGLDRQTIDPSIIQQIEQQHGCKLAGLISDQGVSAYKGDNISDTGELGQFINSVKNGQLKNCILAVETIDRITRLPIHDARKLFATILESGIELIILKMGYELITYDSSSDMGLDLQLQIFLHLAFAESKQKSTRIKASYQSNIKSKSVKCSRHLPFWIEWDNGYKLIDSEVEKLKELFELKLKGYSVLSIVKKLNDSGVRFRNSRTKLVSQTRITNLLKSRTCIGDFGVYSKESGKRELIRWESNFYPAAIDNELFNKVQATFSNTKGTRQTTIKNLFHSISYCSACGGRMAVYHAHREQFYLRCVNATQGRSEHHCKAGAINYPSMIHACLIHYFSYLDVDSIKPTTSIERNSKNEIERLQDELIVLERKRERLRKLFLIEDDVTTIESDLKKVIAKIQNTKSRIDELSIEDDPIVDTVNDIKRTLADYHNPSQDELIKLNSMIRKIVSRIEFKKGSDHKTCRATIHYHNGCIVNLRLYNKNSDPDGYATFKTVWNSEK